MELLVSSWGQSIPVHRLGTTRANRGKSAPRRGGTNRGSRPEGGREVGGAPEGTPRAEEGDQSRVPADVGDGRGDDVVARQLREAAMAEEDPAIREKLWDEYRRYKRGQD